MPEAQSMRAILIKLDEQDYKKLATMAKDWQPPVRPWALAAEFVRQAIKHPSQKEQRNGDK